MAPDPILDNDQGQEEEDSSDSMGDDSSAAAVAPLLNLRFYPSGGSDDNNGDEEEEDDVFEKLLFADAHEDEEYDDSNSHMVNFVISDSREKVVKFADEVAEQRDARRDHEKNRTELLSKIAKLTDMLKDAEKAVEVEKEKRKKKEKNLLKLAKELKKRNQKREEDLERIEELEEKKRYLEHHWILAQKELDQEKTLRTKNQIEMRQEHEHALQDERARYAKALEEHESRVSDMKRFHEKQCDELGRELMKQRLEADRLFNELASKGIVVPRHALFKEEVKKFRNDGFGRMFLPTFITLVAIVATWGYQNDVFSMSGICAPVMPGTQLHGKIHDATYQSPWWAPEAYKQMAFTNICMDPEQDVDDVQPTTVTWNREGKMNKLTLSVGGQVVLKRKVVKAEVLSNKVRLWQRNGHAEEETSLW